MFLLDTNVISHLRRLDKADPQVVRWAETKPVTHFFLSVITMLELEMGAQAIAQKDQQQGLILRHWIDEQLLPRFEGRILSVDLAIARRCAALHVPNPKADRDALIAATALVHGLDLVTRNQADFMIEGVRLINPWQA